MKHSEKLPGKTLAESLGIEVPDSAPGGSRVFPAVAPGAVRSTRGARATDDLQYEGFLDIEGYNTHQRRDHQ